MASDTCESIGKVESPPDVVPLADGGTVALHRFEAAIQGSGAGEDAVTGPGAAALWQFHEAKRRAGLRHPLCPAASPLAGTHSQQPKP